MSSGPGFRPGRLLAMARKETVQLRRDPRSLALAFLLPIVLVLLFGYAISWDVDHIPFTVLDRDRTEQSRALADAFRASGLFVSAGPSADEHAVEVAIARGSARLALVVPPGFAARLGRGGPAPVQAVIDGGDANTAGIALGYAEAVVAGFRPGAGPPLGAETRVWYNETLESRRAIVPGLIAVIMMIVAAMLTSLTIAREWERGTMEQLAATPVRPVEVVVGKLLPYALIGFFDVLVAVGLGLEVFRVPLRGSFTLLLAASGLFLLGALGLGIFISAITRSQLLATQVSMLVTYLPGFLLSGFAFDIEAMPPVLRGISAVVPARYFIVVTRGIFLKGIGFAELWPQLAALGLFAVIGLGLAARSFRKELAD